MPSHEAPADCPKPASTRAGQRNGWKCVGFRFAQVLGRPTNDRFPVCYLSGQILSIQITNPRHPFPGRFVHTNLSQQMRWLRGETNCLSQSCAIQIVVVFVSLPTCVPMLLRSSPQEATRTGRTHSTHLRPFAKQSGATCVPQRPLTSAPPSFRAVTRQHLGARRGRPPGRPRGVKGCPRG